MTALLAYLLGFFNGSNQGWSPLFDVPTYETPRPKGGGDARPPAAPLPPGQSRVVVQYADISNGF
jgi:hypothetical protein